MSKTAEEQKPAAAEPLTEILIKVHMGNVLNGAELANFERLSRRRGRTPGEMVVELIREELATAVASAA